MLIEGTANEKYVKYLTINPREVDSEDDQGLHRTVLPLMEEEQEETDDHSVAENEP